MRQRAILRGLRPRMTAPVGPAGGRCGKQPGLRIVHSHRRERPRLHRLSGPQRIEIEDRH